MSILDHVKLAPLVIRVRPLVWKADGLKHRVDVLYCGLPETFSVVSVDADVGLQQSVLTHDRDIVDPGLSTTRS